MKNRVVVTGAGGMLGRDVVKVLEEQGLDVTALSRKELDITEKGQCASLLKDIRPEIVINCAAFTKVDLCEEESTLAFDVNAKGPKNLADVCKEIGTKLVHISTDYVFDGTSSRPYKEDDQPNPLNIYGKSKLQGEEAVRKSDSDHLIVRTSWLFGKNGPNFIRTMLKLSREKELVQVVNDQRGRPTYTMDLARGIALLIEKGAFGTVNFANSGSCSWYELCCFVLEQAGIKNVKVVPVSSEVFKRPAKRPRYSVLDLSRFKAITGSSPRSWKEAVKGYLKEIGALSQATARNKD